MKTTLNKIRSHRPCEESWGKLLTSLGKTEADDTEVSIEYILDLLGLDDALWALKTVEGYDREIRLLACDYAEHVLHIFEEGCPDDKRPRQAIEVARRYANGLATQEELAAAWCDAVDAARCAVWCDARDAAYAAYDAAVGFGAMDAAWSASKAAKAAEDTELKWQEEQLRKLLESL